MAKARSTTLDQRVEGAFARNGLNTLLLDIKEQVGIISATLQHVMSEQNEARDSRHLMHTKLDAVTNACTGLKVTVDRIAPLVDHLDSERVERRGVSKFLRNKYVIGTGLAGAAAAGWHQWERLLLLLGKIFK